MWGVHVQRSYPSLPANYGYTTWTNYAIILIDVTFCNIRLNVLCKWASRSIFYSYDKTNYMKTGSELSEL